MELVREFARNRSEAAFTELVRRHVNLVYSIARRCTGSDGDAEDVTQAVFVILARKAAGLRARTVLTGWLAETTRYTAACVVRGHARRHAREQEAYMQSTLTDDDTAEAWARLAPHLETGMAQLGERDRTLLTLRFYENKTGPEAAALLGLREAAVHKRTARALEKLQKYFIQQGVALTATVIAGAVAANSVQAAPMGLAAKVSVIAAKGAATTTSIATLVKGTLKAMTWANYKVAAIIALIIGGATTSLVIYSGLHEQKVNPSRPASLVEIKQLFDLATATKPDRCRFEADIELSTPPYTTEQVKAELVEIENFMRDANAHLKPQQKAVWEIVQSNAIVKARSGKRIQHVREWESGNYYRLDVNDEGMGTEKFMRTHPNEYFQTYVNIPNAPFSPYASYEVQRELRDALLFKQTTRQYSQYNLWQAMNMNRDVAELVVTSLINPTNMLKPFVSDFTGLKLDASRAQQLHEQTNLTNSILVLRLEAMDEKLEGKAVTRFTLKESFAMPRGILPDYKPPTFQAEIWVGQISGKAVCLQDGFTNLTEHTATLSQREKYDRAVFPTVLTTTTIKDDASIEKQRVLFNHIEINPSFTDEDAFAPVFPTNYTVSDLTSGKGVLLQNPHPEIPVRK
jgi:RNA polymerase sigma factor (sigma-70 family)